MKKVLFAFPNTGLINYLTMSTVNNMIFATKSAQIVFHMISNSLIHNARNEAVKVALDGNFDYLLFLDSDMTPPPDMIDRLIYHIEISLKEQNCGIISLKAFKRVKPHMPCFYTKVEVKEDGTPNMEVPIQWEQGLMPLKGVGMACCLIDCKLLKEMADRGINRPFDFTTQLGEDLEFCTKATALGYTIFVDTTATAGHVTMIPITEEHFYEYKAKAEAEAKTLVDMEDGKVC